MPDARPPAPGAPPLRVLFVFARLGDGEEEAEVRHLARALPRDRVRLTLVPCFRPEALPPGVHDALRDAGVSLDATPYDLSFEDTVAYLARLLPRFDVVVSCGDAPDLAPALRSLHLRPPLIERGGEGPGALPGAGPLAARRVAAGIAARDAAARRMPGREGLALVLPWADGPLGSAAAPRWLRLLEEVAAEAAPAPEPSLFASIVLGGWECSTHVRRDGRRLDVIAATGHDGAARQDYAQLGRLGLRAMRDGLRWHRIDRGAGYDWSSWTPMLEAARDAGAQVIWDLLHYGLPDGLDVWAPAFPERFRRFARAAALHRREASDEVPWWCPVNEISFHSWAGGDAGYLNPHAHGRGFELKCQLARAAILAAEECLDVDPRARFVHAEPLIAVHHDPGTGRPRREAEGHHDAQWQAFDMIAGRLWPQLGGREALLDVVGLNYYWNNQWIHEGGTIDRDHPLYAPLGDLLFAAHARYGRPLLLAETGTEGDRRAPWAAYVGAEVARARGRGVPVEGVCLYPIANHPGWDDDRDCPNGLLGALPDPRGRPVHEPLAAALPLLDPSLAPDLVPATRRRSA